MSKSGYSYIHYIHYAHYIHYIHYVHYIQLHTLHTLHACMHTTYIHTDVRKYLAYFMKYRPKRSDARRASGVRHAEAPVFEDMRRFESDSSDRACLGCTAAIAPASVARTRSHASLLSGLPERWRSKGDPVFGHELVTGRRCFEAPKVARGS